jgi:hypothetical protein
MAEESAKGGGTESCEPEAVVDPAQVHTVL